MPIFRRARSRPLSFRVLALWALAPICGLLTGALVGHSPVHAQSVTWEDGQPVFHSRPARTNRAPPQQQPSFLGFGGWQDYEPQPRRPRGPAFASGGAKPEISPVAPTVVRRSFDEAPGTVLIDTAGRRLYLVLSDREAYSYPISVGREGFDWYGTEAITRVAEWPDWHPPEEMRMRDPRLPEKMSGGIRNPLGAKALYLGTTLYRIHGTNDVSSIGQAASSGCFRMRNEHVTHLASQIEIGATVKVLKALPPPLPQRKPIDMAGAKSDPGVTIARVGRL